MQRAPFRFLPRAAAHPFDPADVAAAYNYPLEYTGAGFTCGIIELGGSFNFKDLNTYFAERGVPTPRVEAVLVDGARQVSDGPNGADGEVLLDIEVAARVAPDATYRVYFAPNSDQGFYDAILRAVNDGVDVISISWGGPETSWDGGAMDTFDALFAEARRRGITTFVASGDRGSNDGTRRPVTDFPASSPNVIACGGTRLTVGADGQRATEVTWDDNDDTSATGGGDSQHFLGRAVPDVAGNADPVTGYEVLVDGEQFAIGGTSAVAPLYAALVLLLSEALGARLGSKVDLLRTILAHPEVCFDVTAGDNGAYRAGPGRDKTTGFGVVDGTRLLAVLTGSTPVPAPEPTPTPEPAPAPVSPLAALLRAILRWLRSLFG